MPLVSDPCLIDCHAHLDLIDAGGGAVDDAARAGVGRIVTVGIDPPSCRNAVSLAEKYPGVFASVGFHPHDAATVGDDEFRELGELAAHSKVVAIGETGLDFYRDLSPRHLQMEAFLRHIELARELSLPLMVHSREAPAETLAVLREEASGLTVILHCFSLYEHLEECAESGYFMSIAGNVTFRNATGLRDSVARMPPGLILTETDSPYLTPVPHRGNRNSPALIPLVIGSIASIRETAMDELAPVVFDNFQRAFPGAG